MLDDADQRRALLGRSGLGHSVTVMMLALMPEMRRLGHKQKQWMHDLMDQTELTLLGLVRRRFAHGVLS